MNQSCTSEARGVYRKYLLPHSAFLLILILSLLSSSLISTSAATQASIIRGPYLQIQTTNGVVLRWRTDIPSASRVEYGLTFENRTSVVEDLSLTTNHIVALSGLLPNTKYYYAVGASHTSMVGDTTYCFTTAPLAAKPTRIWVIGDNRMNNTYMPPYNMNLDAVSVKNSFLNYTGSRFVDLTLNTGDLGGIYGSDAELQVGFFDTYPEILRQSMLWPCIGNHEQTATWNAAFSLPTAGQCGGVPSNTNRYYSITYGNIHVVSLDSVYSDLSVGGPMYNWLEQDLASNRSDWLIAIWHTPPYSLSYHDSDSEPPMVAMRNNFVPLLEAYGVDLVLNGHNHLYERTFLIDGHYGTSDTLTPDMLKDGGDGREDGTGAYHKPWGNIPHAGAIYAVVGDSGASLYPVYPDAVIYYGESAFGSLVLDIDGNRLDAAFLLDTGTVNDHFTIIKTPPLSITRAGANITVSWSAAATNYVLQASAALGPSANWQNITSGISSSGNLNIYTFTPVSQAPTLFFRLQNTQL